MNLKDKITIVTPIRITTNDHWNLFEQSMRSFYTAIKDRPTHIIWASINNEWQAKYKDLIDKLHINVVEILPGSSSCEGFYKAVEMTTTPYLYPLLADIVTITRRNFLEPCIKALDRDEYMSQVRFTGWPMADGKKNTDCLFTDGKDLFFTAVPDAPLSRMEIDNDVVWIHRMTPKHLEPVLAFNTWHSVLRTDFTSKVLKGVQPHLPHNGSINTTLNILCNTVSLPIRSLHDRNRKGWHKGLKFIEQYTEGFLNMACYTYPYGVGLYGIDEFKRDHMTEIKDVNHGDIQWKNVKK